MSTPDILAGGYPSATHDTPASTYHVIIARAELRERPHGRAARFEQHHHGRATSQRDLARLAQASNFATRAAKEGTLDADQLHAGWADKLSRTLGIPLASVAPSVWHADAGNADARPRDAESSGVVPGEPGGAAGDEHLDPAWT